MVGKMEFEEIRLGACYPDFNTFCRSLKHYEKVSGYRFCKTDCRKRGRSDRPSSWTDNPLQEKFVYLYVRYACRLAYLRTGRICQENRRRDSVMSKRTGCMASIYLSTNRSTGVMCITSINLEHNHDLEAYDVKECAYRVNGIKAEEDHCKVGKSNKRKKTLLVKESVDEPEDALTSDERMDLLLPDEPLSSESQRFYSESEDAMNACQDDNIGYSDQFLQAMHRFQRRGLFCDTALLARDRVVLAHGIVLGAVSPNLYSVCNQHPISSPRPNVIDMSAYSADEVEAFVNVIYSGKMNAESEHADSVHALCVSLGVSFQLQGADGIDNTDNNSVAIRCAAADMKLCDEDEASDVDGQTSVMNAVCEIIGDDPDHKELVENIKTQLAKQTSDDGSQTQTVVLLPVSSANGDDMYVDASSLVLENSDENLDRQFYLEGVGDGQSSLTDETVLMNCIVKNDGYHCTICNEVYKQQVSFLQHQIAHSERVGQPFQCTICNRMFLTQQALKRHELSHLHSQPNSYECELCGSKFPDARSRANHCCSEQKFVKRGNRYECLFCHRLFGFRSRVQDHINTHTGAKPHACELCGLCFADRDYLNKHRVLHTNIYRFLCQKCGKRFQAHQTYTVHLKTHLNLRPYTCNICGIGFTQASSLKGHRRLHTGENPYVCDQCPRRFRLGSILTRHKMIAHMPHEDYPYKCSVCDKRFIANYVLRQHERTHTKPFSCVVCSRRFADASRLKVHKKRCQAVKLKQ